MARVAKFLTAEELQAMSSSDFRREYDRVHSYTRRLLHLSIRNNRESREFYDRYSFFSKRLETEHARLYARELAWRPYERICEAEDKRRRDIQIAQWQRQQERYREMFGIRD